MELTTKPRETCSICRKPTVEKFAPFCSSRCAALDLGRWLGEGYRLPVEDEETDDMPVFLIPEPKD